MFSDQIDGTNHNGSKHPDKNKILCYDQIWETLNPKWTAVGRVGKESSSSGFSHHYVSLEITSRAWLISEVACRIEHVVNKRIPIWTFRDMLQSPVQSRAPSIVIMYRD